MSTTARGNPNRMHLFNFRYLPMHNANRSQSGKAGAEKQGHEPHRQCDKGNTGRACRNRESRDRTAKTFLHVWVKNCTKSQNGTTMRMTARTTSPRMSVSCARYQFKKISDKVKKLLDKSRKLWYHIGNRSKPYPRRGQSVLHCDWIRQVTISEKSPLPTQGKKFLTKSEICDTIQKTQGRPATAA